MINTVNIIGLGALGMLYGRNMMKPLGYENVRFIMDQNRYEKYRDQRYIINGAECKFNMVPLSEAAPADLVIVAVKYPGLKQAIEDIESSVGEGTVIMSVMNGISSEDMIAARYGADKMIYAVAQGMDAVKFGSKLNYTLSGALRLGMYPRGSRENLDAVMDLLTRSGLEYVEEEDIIFRMWSKFMLNVGVNQTCMVYDTTYKGVIEEGEPNLIFISAMREVIAVANAEGVKLTEADLNAYVDIIRSLGPDQMPSMAQDRINRKPGEVDAFSGEVIRLAAKHDIRVPVNRYLNRRAKEIEAQYTNK